MVKRIKVWYKTYTEKPEKMALYTCTPYFIPYYGKYINNRTVLEFNFREYQLDEYCRIERDAYHSVTIIEYPKRMKLFSTFFFELEQ